MRYFNAQAAHLHVRIFLSEPEPLRNISFKMATLEFWYLFTVM